mmetsp:Transcript_7800/g.15675  ORF Transcript_7800/g.15675 Transcript_7800/m.15675 type:complete len:267 (+) Transcript_7800:149-949(+)
MKACVVSRATCGTASPCSASRSSSRMMVRCTMMDANLVATASRPGRYRSSRSTSARACSGSVGSPAAPRLSMPESSLKPPRSASRESGPASWWSGAGTALRSSDVLVGGRERGPADCFWRMARSLAAVWSEETSSSSLSSSGTAPSTSSPGRRKGESAARRGPGNCWAVWCCCRRRERAVWLRGLLAAWEMAWRAAASTTAASSSRMTCCMKFPCGDRSSSAACSEAASRPALASAADVDAVYDWNPSVSSSRRSTLRRSAPSAAP